MIWFVKVFVSIALSICIFTRCSEQPVQFEENNVPFIKIANLLNQTISITDSSLVVVQEGSTGFSPYVILGEFNEQKCSILLKYSGFPADITVSSASLNIGAELVYGSGGEKFTATIHEITSTWDEASIPNITYDSAVLASFEVDGVVESAYTVSLPTGLVQRWVDADSDTLQTEEGIFITFENAGFAKQFLAKGGITLATNYMDGDTLLQVNLQSSQELYIVEGVKEVGGDLIASNYGSHRILMSFNLSSIPDRSSVNFAELIMKLDSENSYIGIAPVNDFWVSIIESDSWLENELKISNVIAASGDLETTSSGTELHIIMTGLVQQWVDNKSLNKGMALTSAKENQDLSLFTFLFNTADSLMQPHLKIHYITFKPF